MDQDWDGTRKIIWAKTLDEMEVIGSSMFTVAVPVEADPEFKAYVFAACVTHSMGNRSIDAQLRKHREEWIRRFLPSNMRSEGRELLIKQLRQQASTRISEICGIQLPSSPGPVAAANVLIRLASTFRGALQLIRLGFAFEAEAVIRLGYEQVAWAYAVAPLADVERIERTVATKAITNLREILPPAGRIYGRLSDLAHMAVDTHHRFVSVDEDDNTRIQIEVHHATKESLWLLIMLLDALYVASEARFCQFGLRRTSLDESSGRISGERPAVSLMREFRTALPANAESTLATWSVR